VPQTERKLVELLEVVKTQGLREDRRKQLVIFTEHKDTLDYLVEQLRPEFDVAVIHGGLKLAERIEQERFFRERAQILVATEAAGEGINLQFCHLIIPWSPHRLPPSAMTSQGSASGRFTRAIGQRNLFTAEVALRETRNPSLLIVLGYLELLADVRPDKFDRAAIRWHGRLELEAPMLTLAESQLALSALVAGTTGIATSSRSNCCVGCCWRHSRHACRVCPSPAHDAVRRDDGACCLCRAGRTKIDNVAKTNYVVYTNRYVRRKKWHPSTY
jgi:hypothetical protein